MNKNIILKDGLEIEVEVSDTEFREISNKKLTNVDSSMAALSLLLQKVGEPVSDALKKVNENVEIDTVKIAVGIKVGAEGNFFIAKSSVGANIQVEMTIKGKNA